MSFAGFLRNLDPKAAFIETDNPPPTAAEYFRLWDDHPGTADKLVVARDPASGGRVGYFVQQYSQAQIFVDIDTSRVTKRVGRPDKFETLRREVSWLRRLAHSTCIPTLLETESDLIVTQYCGEPLRPHNLPEDWRMQVANILLDLFEAGCAHNDIKCDNLVVLDGRIHLIDFGWALPRGATVPKDWPKGIGRQHRLGIHRFDDVAAILAACESAAKGEIDLSRRLAS